MKKYIIPMIAFMLVAGVSNAQITKPQPAKSTKSVSSMTAKPVAKTSPVSTKMTATTAVDKQHPATTAAKKKHHRTHKTAKKSAAKQ